MNTIEEIICKMAQWHAMTLDAMLVKILNEYLDRTDWSIEDLVGRVVAKHYPYDHGRQVYEIYGVPLLEIMPPCCSTITSGIFGPAVETHFEYRRLWNKGEPPGPPSAPEIEP